MGRIGDLNEAPSQTGKPPPGMAGVFVVGPSADIVDGNRVADMRQWAGRLRALLPELERPIIALEGAESLDLAVNDLAEAGVAEFAADHPELLHRVRHCRYSA